MQDIPHRRNDTRAWVEFPAEDNGEALVVAMAEAGVEYVFFTSGSEIGFYQEAIAKAEALGRKAPKLISVTHEHASLNAALGYSAFTGKPSVTAAHVDCGTQHYGGAIHTAWHSGLPVLITAGIPPVAYPGSMRGARESEGHLWLQQTFDQNGIVRQYTKWDHKLEFQDNPGLMVSRALQVACTEPRGPVYLSLPREVTLAPTKSAKFPSLAQLGVARMPAPDPDGIKELAARLIQSNNPHIVVSRSGRNPATVPALVRLAELLGAPIAQSGKRSYHCFPMTHPLFQGFTDLSGADLVLALDTDIPWLIGPNAPPDDAYAAIVDVEPSKRRIPTMEFTADLRLTADALLTITALETELRGRMTPEDRRRCEARAARWAAMSAERRQKLTDAARTASGKTPIDSKWLSYQIGQALGDDCVVFDDTIVLNQVHEYLQCDRPGSYFNNPGSSGGWAPGAAFGAKLAASDRDVVAITGDGFYMFASAIHSLWSARQYNAPYLTIVYQNRSYSTGTIRVARSYPDGYSAKAGYHGGYFDPPIDFAKEAEAAGAYGENVTDPTEVGPAIQRGLKSVRNGTSAVISVWLARYLQEN
ncbi:MAG: thiamine pyrophosphate-requiring protein [Xanthobacteraceae bacterium]